jgi:hypothetical protein
MNAINPSDAVSSATKGLSAVKIRENRMRSHLSAMERVQSIMWGLAAHVRHLVDEAEKRGEMVAKIEAAEGEAFANNAEWLIDMLVDDTHELKRSLEEAGAAS